MSQSEEININPSSEESMRKAYQRALYLLSIKGRFRTELQSRLRKELFSEEAIEAAIEKCRIAGYLNDEERGRRKATSRAQKGYGAKRIALELGQFLEDGEVEDVLGDFDEKKALRDFLQKHPKWLKDPKAKQRLFRRGFTFSSIEEAFRGVDLEDDFLNDDE